MPPTENCGFTVDSKLFEGIFCVHVLRVMTRFRLFRVFQKRDAKTKLQLQQWRVCWQKCPNYISLAMSRTMSVCAHFKKVLNTINISVIAHQKMILNVLKHSHVINASPHWSLMWTFSPILITPGDGGQNFQ